MALAEDALARAVRRRLLRSVIIKDEAGWQALYDQLSKALTVAYSDAMREGIVAALDRLRDLGAGAFTAEDGRSIMAALEVSVGPEALRAAMREPVINLSDALFRMGATEVGTATGVEIAFMRPDLDALDALKQGNLFWVGESWNSYTQDKINTILTEYFEKGMTREGLAARLAEDFATVTGRSEVYWNVVADHMAVKTREIGRVTGYERAGIEMVQVRARMDERTTQVCRHMHGRILKVSDMRAQIAAYNTASKSGNVPEMKRIWPMHGAATDLSQVPTSALEGTCCPPYHHRCRTRTVAYFAPSNAAQTEIGSTEVSLKLHEVEQRVVDREPLSRKEIGALIERAKAAEWAKPGKMRRSFEAHGPALRLPQMADYSQSAVDLIRRADRDAYLTMHYGKDGVGELRMIFEGAAKTSKGMPARVKTVVAVKDSRILTHHRAGENQSEDGRDSLKQPARGIMKGGLLKWLMS